MLKKIIPIITLLLLIPSIAYGATVAFPFQGGTGIGSATAGDIGKCLKVSNNSPFTYSFESCAGSVATTTWEDINASSTIQIYFDRANTAFNWGNHALAGYLLQADWEATTTDALLEGASNLYFTNARVGNYIDASSTLQTIFSRANTSFNWGDHALAGYLLQADWEATTTDSLAEGVNNLYWTQQRFDNAYNATTTLNGFNPALYVLISSFQGLWDTAFNSTSTWAHFASNFNSLFSGKTTSDLTEGSNLYYTDARVGNYISGSSTLQTTFNNANTSFGWGDHSLAGYFLSSNFNSSWDSRFLATSTHPGNFVFDGNVTSTATIHASEYCLLNDCITSWPTGGSGGNPFNQWVDTTNTPEFFGLTMNTNSSFATTTIGDTNNYITFGRTTYTGGLGVLDFPTIEFTSTGNPLSEGIGGVVDGFGIFGTDADNPTLAFFPGDFADSGDIALMQYASGTGTFIVNDSSSSGNLLFGTVGSIFASNSFLIGTTTTSTPYGLLVENKNIRNQSTNNYGLGDYTTAFETGLITEVPFFGTQQVANYAVSTSTDDTNNTSTVGIIGAGKSGGVYGLGRQVGAAGVLEDAYITVGILGNKLNDRTRVGVYGLSPSATSTGTNVGVRGQASSGLLNYGLFGLATGNTGTKYGVFASTTGTGINYAGYFGGDVFVTNGGVTSTESIHSPEFCLAGNCITSWGVSSPWTSYANGIYYNGGTVAIGTTTPDTSAGLVVASTTAQVGIQSIGTNFGGFFQGGTYGVFAIGNDIGLVASSTAGVAGKGSIYGVSGTLNDDSGAVGYLGLHRYTNQGLYGTGGVYGEVDNATTTGVNIGLVGYADGGLYNYAGYFAGGDVFVNDNLGIGTSTPFSKLSVIGDIYSEANRNIGDFNFSTIGRTNALVENLFDPGSGENWYIGSYISATSTEYDQASTTIGIYGNGQTAGIIGYGHNVGLIGAGQEQGGLFVCTDPDCYAVNAQGNLGVSGNSLVIGNSTTTGLTALGASLFDIGSFTVGTVEDGVASTTKPSIEFSVLDLPALAGFGVQVPLINAKVCADPLGFCITNGLGALNAVFIAEDTSLEENNPTLSFANYDGSDVGTLEYNTSSDKFIFFEVTQVDFQSPLLIATSSPWLVFTETGGNNAAVQYVEGSDFLSFVNASTYLFDNYITVGGSSATSTFAGNVSIANGKNLQVSNIFAYSPLNIWSNTIFNGNSTTTGSLHTNELFVGGNKVNLASFFYASSSDLLIGSNTSNAVVATTTIPANIIGTNGAIKVTGYFTTPSSVGNNNCTYTFSVQYGGQLLASGMTINYSTSQRGGSGTFTSYIYGNNSASSQHGAVNFQTSYPTAVVNTPGTVSNSSRIIGTTNSSIDQSFGVRVTTANVTGCTLTNQSWIIEKIN